MQLTQTKLLDLRVDFVFKKLFGSNGSEKILTKFLNEILKPPEEEKIASVTILDKELIPEHREDKRVILDVHAKATDGRRFNVEIQLANEKNMERRTLYYWSRIFTEDFKKGCSYSELSRTITINLLNFRLFPQDEEMYHSSFQVEERVRHFPLTDLMEIHFVELPKFLVKWRKQEVQLSQDPLVLWLLMLEAAEDQSILSVLEENIMQKDDPILKEAIERWEYLSRDPETIRAYEARLKAETDRLAFIRETEIQLQKREEKGEKKGYKKGHEKGKQEGRQEEKVETAKKMLRKGMDIDLTVELTALPLEKIKQLQLEIRAEEKRTKSKMIE